VAALYLRFIFFTFGVKCAAVGVRVCLPGLVCNMILVEPYYSVGGTNEIVFLFICADAVLWKWYDVKRNYCIVVLTYGIILCVLYPLVMLCFSRMRRALCS
jgi:hypothetical protein